ncbi:MAG: FtsH protease activity modulator HflK [Magnetococcales bacterium]|nr:FtsH protease activity modulator HflK [Magnetococcales bacterium]
MSWNNDGGGSQGPWGQQGGGAPQPPDIEQLLNSMRDKFGEGKFGGFKTWPFLLGIAFLIWMASGIYVVKPDEQGVVLRFGRYVHTTTPGPHFHWPYPIEEVLTPRVTEMQRIEIGYRTRGASGSRMSAAGFRRQASSSRLNQPIDVPEESLMLTGDENIIDIDLAVQFRINNAADSLFNLQNPATDPYRAVRNAAESAIRQVIGSTRIDQALTTGKEAIQQDTKRTMQAILDTYKSGLLVESVQLQQVAPPQEVVHAFKDVASAREDRERAINEAQGYSNDILPKAKGEAERRIRKAEGYKEAKVARATGDANRFLAMLEEYKKAKHVTRQRLYLETMEKVLSGSRKVIMDPNVSRGVMPFLPLGSLKDGGVR